MRGKWMMGTIVLLAVGLVVTLLIGFNKTEKLTALVLREQIVFELLTLNRMITDQVDRDWENPDVVAYTFGQVTIGITHAKKYGNEAGSLSQKEAQILDTLFDNLTDYHLFNETPVEQKFEQLAKTIKEAGFESSNSSLFVENKAQLLQRFEVLAAELD